MLVAMCPQVWIAVVCLLQIRQATAVGKIIGVEGNQLVLPCRPNPNSTIDLVLWYKGHQTVYTIDSRIPDNPVFYSNRSNIVPGRGADLVFSPVRKQDEGQYRCRVDFKRQSSWNTIMNLSVIMPPSKPIIYDENGTSLSGLIGPYKEGMTLILTCESSGSPLPSITWWKENALLDAESEYVKGSIVRNHLTIMKLKRSDLGSRLSCQATNNNHSIPLSNSVQVNMKFEIEKVQITGGEKTVAGKPCKLKCRAWGGRPVVVFTWLLRDKTMAKIKRRVYPNSTFAVSTWSFTPVSDDDGAQVTCVARNPDFPGTSVKHDYFMDVRYPPTCRLTTTHNGILKEGDEITMHCQVNSNPKNYKLKWRHNGQLLTDKVAIDVSFQKDRLQLRNISRTLAGIYTCVASNELGDGESNPLALHISYAPVCKPFQKRVYNVARKDSVNISCEVDAYPEISEFSWEYQGASVPRSEWRQEAYRSVLVYRPMTLLDYGTLFCNAKNPAGQLEVPCEFHLNPAGIPDPLSNCTVSNVSDSSLQLDCEKGFDGGLPQYFIMEVFRAVDSTLVTNVTSTLPKFFLTGLLPGSKLDLALYSCNSVGRSTPLYLNLETLGLALQLTSNPVSMVLLGVGLTSLVLILVLLLACLLRLRRQPSKVITKEEVPLRTGQPEDPDIITVSKEIEEWVPLKS